MIGFIGAGNMAEAIISGLRKKSRLTIVVSDKKRERLNYLKSTYKIRTAPGNLHVLKSVETVILAVKPQNMDEVIDELRGSVTEKNLIISIAAGIRLSYLSEGLKTGRVMRVMPNTPALAGEGMSVISPMKKVKKSDMKQAIDIFRAVGEVAVMDEGKMDVVTALSGSGPAFFAHIIESFAEAGVRMGLSYQDALSLTLQTASGTVKMMKGGKGPSELKQMVTSPGGTTAAGLFRMEHNALKAALMEAVEAATRRAEELSRR
jgi:pyrroline-5-carboxylate reductase